MGERSEGGGQADGGHVLKVPHGGLVDMLMFIYYWHVCGDGATRSIRSIAVARASELRAP